MGADGDDVDAVISAVARALRTEVDDRTDELTARFVHVIPEFRHDDAVRELMVSSTASNLTAIIDLLDHGIPVDDIDVPAAAAEYARRFAQRDLSLEALLRAYRLGEHDVVQRCVALLEGLDLGTTAALRAASELSRRVHRYIDRTIEALIDIYEDERRRWHGLAGAARAATLRMVLDSGEMDVAAAEESLGISLRGHHRAAVLWCPGGTTRMEEVQRDLHRVVVATPLSTLVDPGCLWAWWSGTSRPPVDAASFETLLGAHPGLRIALGGVGDGLAGFRISHREARRARAVAEMAPDGPPPLTEYDDVGLAALLSEHLDVLRAWVARTLGDLAADDENPARLRATLEAYLGADGSSGEAAARLHLHKNTVLYRVRRAEEQLGRPLQGHRLDVEVALMLCDRLGSAVLTA
jgi:DNA-binding PucR family transcriptional regulator